MIYVGSTPIGTVMTAPVIKQIEGVDTSDATALAQHILAGYTAYVNGVKITGTYVPLDTSDATATAANLAEGETAYVNGVKITGTMEAAENLSF